MTARLKLLDLVAQDIAKCTACKLHEGRLNTVPGTGNPYSKVVFCAEAPGADEDQQGLPFVGRAGKLLTKMIEAMGLRREDIFIINTLKCRPPNNRKPEPDELSACRKYLDMQLEIIQPEIIVALGATAANALLGPGPGVTNRNGNWEQITINNKQINVLVTFHPSALLRNPGWKPLAAEALKKVVDKLNGA